MHIALVHRVASGASPALTTIVLDGVAAASSTVMPSPASRSRRFLLGNGLTGFTVGFDGKLYSKLIVFAILRLHCLCFDFAADPPDHMMKTHAVAGG